MAILLLSSLKSSHNRHQLVSNEPAASNKTQEVHAGRQSPARVIYSRPADRARQRARALPEAADLLSAGIE